MTTVIGLTGNIGTGKSSVLHMLAELGAQTIDADRKHSYSVLLNQ